jgi:2-methylisocitrate lyase-like PEP mutase family enzyme
LPAGAPDNGQEDYLQSGFKSNENNRRGTHMESKYNLLDRAEIFRSLHKTPVFVMANAWDAVSACIFEKAGFKAIGTTSAGISSTLGFPDGQHIDVEATATVVRSLVSRTNVPISADIEAGYSETTQGVIESARAVMMAGAVGINLEDSTGDPKCPLLDIAQQKERISAIAELASPQGLRLFINARTDVYLLQTAEGAKNLLKSAVQRANAYIEAGADCIFIPDFENLDKSTISALVNEIEAPVNIIAGRNTPSLADLKEIGVTRVSLGPRPMRATLAMLKRMATEILEQGTFSQMTADTISYNEVNELFTGDN